MYRFYEGNPYDIHTWDLETLPQWFKDPSVLPSLSEQVPNLSYCRWLAKGVPVTQGFPGKTRCPFSTISDDREWGFLDDPESIAIDSLVSLEKFLKPNFQRAFRMNREEFYILYLNNQLELVEHNAFYGRVNEHRVRVETSIIRNKKKSDPSIDIVVLVHNHCYENDNIPSQPDIKLTELTKRICDEIGVQLQDHVIFDKLWQSYSFRIDPEMDILSC